MTQAISDFFCNTFGSAWLATFLIAMLPFIELKGAIPFGTSIKIWADAALSPWMALLYSFLGSCLVVPFLALLVKPLFKALNKFKFFKSIINFFTEGLIKKGKNKAGWVAMLSVFVFVAFPVPLTGVWTGTVFAVFLGLNFWQTLACVFTGNFVCALLVTFLCLIFPNATNIILYVFVCLVVVALAIKIVLHIVHKKKQPPANQEKNSKTY